MSLPPIESTIQENRGLFKSVATNIGWAFGKVTELTGSITKTSGSLTQKLAGVIIPSQEDTNPYYSGTARRLLGNTIDYTGQAIGKTGELTESFGKWIKPCHTEEQEKPHYGPLKKEQTHHKTESDRIEKRSNYQKTMDGTLWITENGMRGSS